MKRNLLGMLMICSLYSSLFVTISSCTEKPKSVKRVSEVEGPESKSNEIKRTNEALADTVTFDYFEDYISLTSKAEILDQFGSANCKDGVSTYAEGTITVKHTILTNPETKFKVKYVWNQKDPKKLDFIEASHLIYDNEYNILGRQKIASKCGMTLGMSINQLVKWNEKDIEFSGFGWDYEGTVIAQDMSKLDDCNVKIKLSMRQDVNTDNFITLYGDQLLKSSNSLVKKAPIFVGEFTLYNKE